jgi:integrase/recombinase XerC
MTTFACSCSPERQSAVVNPQCRSTVNASPDSQRVSSSTGVHPSMRSNATSTRFPPNQYGLSTRHCSYRVLRTFYRWLENQYGLPNPMANLRAPILGKPILPSLTRVQIQYLLDSADCVRDRAIIATLTESGLRLSELANIKASDIDWQAKTIRTIGKGRKEAYAPFGGLSETYLREWLSEYQPNGSIWGLNYWGITQMLKRLERQTGLKCNPHVFRRSFAVLLRKAGVDCLVIRDLGRWESVQMVERYTRSFNFNDAMKFYKGTLGG